MKKVIRSIVAFVVIFICVGETGQAAVLGDDYPVVWRQAAPDAMVDPWTMYNRECVSFVAWRLHASNQFELPIGFGSAYQWGSQAQARGYHVDGQPAIGSVAWFRSGHVAWVADVHGDQVIIEEYNYNYTYNYHRRQVNCQAVTGFIHFKDQATGSGTSVTAQSIRVGQRVKFPNVYQVTTVNQKRNTVTSDRLSGGTSTRLNEIDAGPLDETTASGLKSRDQVLAKGEYFIVNGTYRVLAVDYPTSGIKVRIGAYDTWLDWRQAEIMP